MKKKPPTDNQDQQGSVPQPNPPPYAGYPPPYVVYPAEKPINLLEYWQVLVEHKKLIGIITGASTPYDAQGNTERGVYFLDTLQPAVVGV